MILMLDSQNSDFSYFATVLYWWIYIDVNVVCHTIQKVCIEKSIFKKVDSIYPAVCKCDMKVDYRRNITSRDGDMAN